MANEKRLIRVDVILKGIETFKRCYEENEKELTPVIVKAAFTALSMVEQFAKETPTVDAVEVVHGRWDIFDDGYGCELMCCSVCRSEFYDGDNDTVDHPHNYCPNCGAKMDGDGND